MRLSPKGKAELLSAGRRFLWLSLVLYAGLTVGYWTAHIFSPESTGPVTDSVVFVSLIAAVTFGGLYTAAVTIKFQGPRKRGHSPPAKSHRTHRKSKPAGTTAGPDHGSGNAHPRSAPAVSEPEVSPDGAPISSTARPHPASPGQAIIRKRLENEAAEREAVRLRAAASDPFADDP